MSNQCIVCFIAFFDSEDIWFGEIILSLSKLLPTICSLKLFHGGHFEFCMIMMSNKCIVCFIAFLNIEDIWFGEIISSLSHYPNEDMITLVIAWRPFRILTPICELYQTFSYSVVYSEHFYNMHYTYISMTHRLIKMSLLYVQ